MEIQNKFELIQIQGGINLTGTLLSSISKGINSILEVGRSLGSAIRRAWSGKLCSL